MQILHHQFQIKRTQLCYAALTVATSAVAVYLDHTAGSKLATDAALKTLLAGFTTGGAGLLCNVVATHIMEMRHVKEAESADDILRNGFLARAVGRTISVIAENAAGSDEFEPVCRDEFRAFAAVIAGGWVRFVEKDKKDRLLLDHYHQITDSELTGIFHDSEHPGVDPSVLHEKDWVLILGAVAGPDSNSAASLSPTAIYLLAPMLSASFVHAFRQIITTDDTESCRAFRRLTLDFFSDLEARAERIENYAERIEQIARRLDRKSDETLDLVKSLLDRGMVSEPTGLPYRTFPVTLLNNHRPFSGRGDLLAQVDRNLLASNRVALTGMPGVGKSAAAFEFAWTRNANYDFIFWLNARDDTKELDDGSNATKADSAVRAAYDALGRKLKPSIASAAKQEEAVEAALEWLATNDKWLLILDNADGVRYWDERLLPVGRGHVLLTARPRLLPEAFTAESVEIMEAYEGAQCLLDWARLPTLNDRQFSDACRLSLELGGLPLALEQAGAFIAATGISISDYLQMHAADPEELLRDDYEAPSASAQTVCKTFNIAMREIEKRAPEAAELLTLCAFLAPDVIPETLFTTYRRNEDSESVFSPSLADTLSNAARWTKLKRVFLEFALLKLDNDAKTFSVHRVVQEVLRVGKEEALQKLYAKKIAILLARATPSGKFGTWAECELLLPHQRASLRDIERLNIETAAAEEMCRKAGYYLIKRAATVFSEPFVLRAQAISQKIYGDNHDVTAESLSTLAHLYQSQGRYIEAEPLHERALTIYESLHGSSHPKTAAMVNSLAFVSDLRGRYARAEHLFQRALNIRESELGVDHPDTATTLSDLAFLFKLQEKYEEAESLFVRALSIREIVLRATHPRTATTLNDLAFLYKLQGRYSEAEALFSRALEIRESMLGKTHPRTAATLHDLAFLYKLQGRYLEAEPLFSRSLTIREEVLGNAHPETAISLTGLAILRHRQAKTIEAEQLMVRAIEIREASLGLAHPETAKSYDIWAEILEEAGRKSEAHSKREKAHYIRTAHRESNLNV